MKMGLADILEETKYEADEQISSQVDFVIELIESGKELVLLTTNWLKKYYLTIYILDRKG